ncbi:Outer membrane receptor proteins, mostly Fe transport [Sphingomonas laterariae]|uniref:Outer membrane receptor proteins, mostly Fe transport n=1 Tax=Edaphosphingomonas laterariae TaxID=861865 RepID=A0A239BZ47_9SPHN|nr:TonB-dependent receptor [Sphingomonas laterariae]SNS12688.1 Outer membrane receptor proteins, mostly Fe transport [Sphingomonas laterariae]
MLATPALADPAAAAAAAAEAPGEVIVVTAQKRAQSILDVPLSLSAFDARTLDNIGADTLEDVSLYTPGFEVREQSVGAPGFVIRGITSDGIGEQRVSIYLDGVSTSAAVASSFELYDEERIEIAKGPQSTLFGRGALIGGVNIIQKKAGNDFELQGTLGIGDYGYWLVEGVANAPLVDDVLAVRVAVRQRKRDGYIENLAGGADFNAMDTLAYRAAVRFSPASNLRFDLIYNREENTPNGGTGFKSNMFLPRDPKTGAVVGDLEPGSGVVLGSFGGLAGNRLYIDRTIDDVTLLGSWELNDAFTLNSITGYRKYRNVESFDPDGTWMNIIAGVGETWGDQTTQEVRLSYDNDGAFHGIFGASYVDLSNSDRYIFQFDERATALLFTGGLLRAAPMGMTEAEILAALGPAGGFLKPAHIDDSTFAQSARTVDLYGDGTFDVTDRLSLTGGLRWTHDKKEATVVGTLPNGASRLTGGGIFFQPTANGATLRTDGTFSGFSWRAAAEYKLGDTVNSYFTYSRGRRSPALNISSTASASTAPAEIVNSYELGLKGSALAGKLTFDGSVYYYDYSNFQTVKTIDGTLTTVNAGEAEAYGFEGQVQAKPASWATLFANYSYNHARLTSGDYDGNRFRNAPDHTFSVGAFFTAPIGATELYFNPAYSWQSKFFFDDDNDRSGLQPADFAVDEYQNAYGLLNLRLGLRSEDERWGVEVALKNALNQDYVIDAGNTGDNFGIPSFIAGQPRMFSAEFKFKF